jgi:hypothetical protein
MPSRGEDYQSEDTMAKIREKHEADLGDEGRSVGKTAETEKCSDEQSFGFTSLQELTAASVLGYSNSHTTLHMSGLPNQAWGDRWASSERRRTSLSEENE